MHFLWMGERSVPISILIIMAVLMVLSLALEYLASAMGARKLGATWRGVLGATLGGIVGFFFGLPGWILGPMLGALCLNVWGGTPPKRRPRQESEPSWVLWLVHWENSWLHGSWF